MCGSTTSVGTERFRIGSLAVLELFRRNTEIDLDPAVNDAHRVRVHRAHRGEGLHLAREQVEARAMSRTLDQAVLELALAQHAAVVRADVVDRAPRAVGAVAEGETPAVDVYDGHLPRRDLGLSGDLDEPAHRGCAPSGNLTRPAPRAPRCGRCAAPAPRARAPAPGRRGCRSPRAGRSPARASAPRSTDRGRVTSRRRARPDR